MDTKTPEAILKETRQAKGIPIESVHEATKIPLDVLKGMEEGYTVRALALPFYRKQFLKMYANFLGIELKAEVFVEPPKEEKKVLPFKKITLRKEFTEPKKWISLTKQQKQQIVLALGAILVVFLVTKAVGFVGKKFSEWYNSRPRVVKVPKQQPVVKPPEKKVEPPQAPKVEVKKEEPKKENIVKEPAVKQEPPPVTPIPVAKKEPLSPAPQVRQNTPIPAVSEPGKMVNLTVRAKKKSWLQVKVDGTTVFQSSLQKGAVENWQANEKIELTGNNILFLEFEVNGKMIGTLGRSEGRARKLIVTKEGLSVKR